MARLLELLADGAYHAKDELLAALGVGEPDLLAQVQVLREVFNVDVMCCVRRGYCLSSALSLLMGSQELAEKLGFDCYVLESIDSTNAEALRLYSSGVATPFMVTAESQSAGRGRRGREWLSPFGENIYLSMAFSVGSDASKLEGLSLSVGVAVYRALVSLGLVGLGLKWPNDVLLCDRKLSGILLELFGDPVKGYVVVVGVGVNTNMQAAPIDQAWTSLRVALGRLIDRNWLLVRLSEEIAACVERHLECGFAVHRQAWQAANLWRGKEARLRGGDVLEFGVIEGVDDSGALILRQGDRLSVYSGGELSLRLAHDS